MPYNPLPTIQTQQPRNTFVWIQGGEATAANYPVAAGETVLLVDSAYAKALHGNRRGL